MRVVGVRDTLDRQHAMLRDVAWPRWVELATTLSALGLGACIVAVAVADDLLGGSSDVSPVAVALVVASVVPWGLCLLGMNPVRHALLFGVLVVAPLAVLNLAGDRLGIADLQRDDWEHTGMLLVFLVAQTATHAAWRTMFAVTAAVVAVFVARTWVAGDLSYATPWYFGVLLAFGAGLALRANILNQHRLELAQDELARRAVADERRRIAREVHDVVAHTLSVTMLHLSAARLAVDRAPERVPDALDEAQRQGRAGLADIRRMVRLLRVDDPGAAGEDRPTGVEATGPAAPTLEEVGDLVEGYRSAGLAVRFDVDGSADVSPAVGATLYRVAQESLANVARHGLGSAELTISLEDDGATLVVTNPCPPPGAHVPMGNGLTGMQERVSGLGGAFRAGPEPTTDDRATWWQVEARLPRVPA